MSFVLNLNDKCLEAVNVFITLTVVQKHLSSLTISISHTRPTVSASAGVINRRSSCNIFRLIMQRGQMSLNKSQVILI